MVGRFLESWILLENISVVTKARRKIIPSKWSLLGEVFIFSQWGRLLVGQYYTTIDSKVLKRSLESLIPHENIIAMMKARRAITSPKEFTLGGVFVLSQWGRLLVGQNYTTTILILWFSQTRVEILSNKARIIIDPHKCKREPINRSQITIQWDINKKKIEK